MNANLISRTKTRVSNKFYATLPSGVAEQVKQFLNQFDHTSMGGIKVTTIDVQEVTVLYTFTLDEGTKLLGIRADGQAVSIEVAADHNIGGANMTSQIGREFNMPAGSYLVEVSLFMGKYYANLYHVEAEDVHGLVDIINADKGMQVI